MTGHMKTDVHRGRCYLKGGVSMRFNFLTCAEVKFLRYMVSVINRRDNRELHFWVADRDAAAAASGLVC